MAKGLEQVKCKVCIAAFKNTSWNFDTISGKDAMIKFHQKIPLHKSMLAWTNKQLEDFANSIGNTMGYARSYKKVDKEEEIKQGEAQAAMDFTTELYKEH